MLGASGAFPGAGLACSGYVVETDTTRLVVDLGWGTLTRLFALLGDHTGDLIDAVAITHEHPDHMADLYGLFRARWYARPDSPPIPLIAPPGVIDRLRLDHSGDDDSLFRVFEWQTHSDQPTLIGDTEIRTRALPHYVTNHGVRVSSSQGVVAFTGDTGPCAELATLGANADLFVVDATDRHQQPGVPPEPPQTPPFNLTAAEAGAAAREADASILVLTHLWPGNDAEQSRHEAAKAFDGPVVVARDGMTIDFP